MLQENVHSGYSSALECANRQGSVTRCLTYRFPCELLVISFERGVGRRPHELHFLGKVVLSYFAFSPVSNDLHEAHVSSNWNAEEEFREPTMGCPPHPLLKRSVLWNGTRIAHSQLMKACLVLGNGSYISCGSFPRDLVKLIGIEQHPLWTAGRHDMTSCSLVFPLLLQWIFHLRDAWKR